MLAFLKAKYGPLPAWAWGAIAVAVIAVIIIWRRGSSSAPTGATASPTTGGGGWGDAWGQNGLPQGISPAGGAAATSAPTQIHTASAPQTSVPIAARGNFNPPAPAAVAGSGLRFRQANGTFASPASQRAANAPAPRTPPDRTGRGISAVNQRL